MDSQIPRTYATVHGFHGFRNQSAKVSHRNGLVVTTELTTTTEAASWYSTNHPLCYITDTLRCRALFEILQITMVSLE